MSPVNPNQLDKTGKVVLDHVYNLDRPDGYYDAMEMLDYGLPQQAKPLFSRILQLLRESRGLDEVKLVDLGCSYGVNGALLKWGLELGELIEHYHEASNRFPERAKLLEYDRRWLQQHQPQPLEILGVDISRNALDYALEAGFIDSKIVGNFEQQPLSASQQLRVQNADLIISTGCIGYVTEKTLSALLQAAKPNRPWMAHFVLRMFPFTPMQDMLERDDYAILKSRRPLRQRRFASELERDSAIDRLAGMGIDTEGYESDGWYYADLFFAVPKDELPEIRPQAETFLQF